MTADEMFKALVIATWPAALLYPAIYATGMRWWESWIGRSLLTKALGVFIMVSFSLLFWVLGPNYPGRDIVRITGMSLVCLGTWMALLTMLRVISRRDR